MGPLRPSELQVNRVPNHIPFPPPLGLPLGKQCGFLTSLNNGLCPPPQGYVKGSEVEGKKESLPL